MSQLGSPTLLREDGLRVSLQCLGPPSVTFCVQALAASNVRPPERKKKSIRVLEKHPAKKQIHLASILAWREPKYLLLGHSADPAGPGKQVLYDLVVKQKSTSRWFPATNQPGYKELLNANQSVNERGK